MGFADDLIKMKKILDEDQSYTPSNNSYNSSFANTLINTKKILDQDYSVPTTINTINPVDEVNNALINAVTKSAPNLKTSKKEEKTAGDIAGYLGKNLGAGALNWATGMVDLPYQQELAGAELAKNKSNTQNLLEGTAKAIDPNVLGNIVSIPDKANRMAQIALDDEMSNWNKTKNIALQLISDNDIRKRTEGLAQIKSALSQMTNGKIINPNEEATKAMDVINKPSNALNQNIAEETENMPWLAQKGGEIAQVIGYQVPSAITTAATGNPGIGLATMGLGAAGSGTKEALDKGADPLTATDVGWTKGGIEVGTEMLTGGAKWFGKGSLDDVTNNLVNKYVKNNLANWATKQFLSGLGEVFEETISDIAGVQIDQATTDPNAKYTMKDWLNTVVSTLISTGIMNTAYEGINYGISKKATGKGKTSYQINKEELKQYNKVQDMVNQEMATIDTSNMSNKEVRQTRNKIENEITNKIADGLNDIISQADEEAFYYSQRTNETNNELEEVEQQDIKDTMDALNLEENIEENIEENLEEETTQDTTPITEDEDLNIELNRNEVVKDVENYAEQNNIQQLTQEDIQNYIEEALAKQELNEETKEMLRPKYNDILQDYLKDQNKPNIPDSIKALASPKLSNRALENMPRNSAKLELKEGLRKGIVPDSKIASAQNNVENQLEYQYKGFEDLGRRRMQPSAEAVFEKTNRNQELNDLIASARTNNMEVTTALGLMNKLFNQRNVRATFDASYFTGRDAGSKNAFWRVQRNNNGKILLDKNGQIMREVLLNPNADSRKTLEQVAVHELFHDMFNDSNNKNAQRIYDAVLKYAKENTTNFEEARKSLAEAYKNEYKEEYRSNPEAFEKMIDEEAVADILGNKLGNQEFINELVSKNRTLAEKIHDAIVSFLNKLNKLTGYKNEKLFWQDMERKYAKALNTKYSQELRANNQKNSTSEMSNQVDSNGKKLSNEQVNYFKDSKVRDENGNLLEVYKGDDNAYTVFDREKAGTRGAYYGSGFYFTSDPNEASFYGDVNNYYLNINNPYKVKSDMIQKNGSVDFAPDFYKQIENKFKNDLPFNWEYLKGKQKGDATRDILEKNGYDGVFNGTNYIAFNSNQIKNTDNLTPTKSDDIRFAKEVAKNNELEYNEDGIQIADKEEYGSLRNTVTYLQSQNLLNKNGVDFLENGKYWYMISSKGFSNFKPVARIEMDGNENLIDTIKGEYKNGINTKSKTFDNIVESIKNERNTSGRDNVNVEARETTRKNDKLYNREQEQHNRTKSAKQGRRTNEELKNSSFSIDKKTGKLQENGKDVTLETSKTGNTGTLMAIHNLSEEKLKGILELGGFPVPSIAVTNPNIVDHKGYGNISVLFDKSTIDPANKNNEVYDRDVWSPKFPQISREINDKNIDKVAPKIGMSDSSLQSLAEDYNNVEDLSYRLSRDADIVEKYLNDNKIKYDNDTNIYNLAKENGILEYLEDQLKDVYGEKGIYNQKSYLTDNGNRRTFWQLHDKYNLENIVNNLIKQKTVGSHVDFTGEGFGNLQARMANKFKSLEDIKKNESKIMSKTDADAVVSALADKLNSSMVKLAELYGDKFDALWDMDSINYQIQELSKAKNVSVDEYYNIANKYNPTLAKADKKTVQDIVDTMNELKNIPTDYFEAKPQRAVGLDEVQALVIPNTTSTEFKKQLQDAGLNYYEYDPNVDGDRQRVINQFDDLKFSKENQTWQDYLDKEFPNKGTGTRVKDLKQGKKTTKQEKSQETPKKEVKKETKKEVNYLTNAEQQELDGLRDLENSGWTELTKEEQQRVEQLEKKAQGYVTKFPELKTNNKFEDIKDIYSKYRDTEMSKENNEVLKQAKDFIKANNQNRRTIEEWKQIAEYIGSNANINNSQDLQKLAIETWFETKPNTKEHLNRQGKKYIPFAVQDWVNSVYKGAQVGQDVKFSVEETKDSKGNEVELAPITEKVYEKVNQKPTKNQVMPDLSNETLNVGDKKVSNFYSNITEKSKFITEENRESLKDNENLKYYDAITNKDTLEKAMDKLDTDAEQQVGEFFAKDNFTAEDMATGWILAKRYQDAGNYEAMSNVIETMREKGTKSGQAIQILGMLQRLTPEGMEYYAQKKLDNAYNKFVENKSKKQIDKYAQDFTLTAEEHQFIKDTMEKVEKMTNDDDKKVEVAKIVKMLSDKIPPEKGSRIKAWMRISMLGNPKTQVRNVVGNAIIQPFNWLGDTVASRIDKIMSKKTGVRTKGDTDFGALAGGFVKGAKEAYRDAKLGIDTRDINLDRFEENIGAKPFYEGHKGKGSKILNTGAKVLNKTNKILGDVMSGGDRVFYQAIYDNSLKNQMKLNGVETPTQEMMDIAEQEALSRTWNDSNEYTKAVLQIRNAMNKLNIKGYGLGDVLVPFAKTPANLTKAIVDYSPVGLARSILQDGKNYRNSLQNGQFNAQMQHKFADSLGKGFAGSLLWVAAYALAKAGITTGASDDDKDVANFMRNTLGIQPYSVKIGDKSFTYDWAQPIAAPFAAMADTVKLSEKEEKDLGSIIRTMTSSASNILLEQSFLSSIQDVFNSYEGPTAAIKQQIEDLPARATPTFFKQIADLIDPTSRQTYVKGDTVQTMKNKVQVKIPGASKELTSQRDTLGREIEKYGGNDNPLKYAFNVFLNPANTNKGKVSAAAEEIYDVYKNTGDKTIMPRQVGYSEYVSGSTIPLSAEERNEWQKLSGEKIEENVKALTSSAKYNAMSYEDKADVINGIVNYSYAKAKSDMFGTQISNQYKTAAKKEAEGVPLYDYYIDRVSKRR